jgi:chloramphenicol O-acetyltransferase type A
MKRALDVTTWSRKDHFNFFKAFEEPFFGVCVVVDCTRAYQAAKAGGDSFFLLYLHKSLVAANQIEPFRYRIAGDQVWVYDRIHASPTINRPDGTFGFAYMDFYEDFQQFKTEAETAVEQVRSSRGLIPAVSGENVVHYSSLPWLDFSAVSHARSFSFRDSIPKITFGKMTDHQGTKKMPVSVHVHHGLMDGYHVGQYFERFQGLLEEGF